MKKIIILVNDIINMSFKFINNLAMLPEDTQNKYKLAVVKNRRL